MKKAIDVIYYLLTAYLLVIVLLSIFRADLAMAADYGLQAVAVVWLVCHIVRLKQQRAKRRKVREDYRNRLLELMSGQRMVVG